MAVRIYFEIGHEASIRNKKTLEGFTHDWEVFVRGCDGAEIHYFVEKVVFYLHETFPKPKRVIKEPPYSLKESGYAGFNLPIEIYLRNNNEPKKIRFNYDLHLQNVGPPINKVQKEKYVFTNCTEEFKSRLLKGGGIISSKSEFDDNRQGGDEKNHQMINKPKLSGCDIKKQKTVGAGEPSREFNAIFGSPILTSKTNAEKQVPQIKSQEMKDKSRNKHSPQKDSHRDKDKGRSEEKKAKEGKVSKDKGKERERSKDKTVKKERSPPPRPKSPSPRVSSSPPPPAKHSPARFSSPTIRHKDSSKSSHEKQREEKRQKKRHKESGGKHADEAVGKSSDSKQQHKEIVGKSDKKDQISATVGKIKSESPKRDKSKESKYQARDSLPKDEKSSDKSYEKNKYKKKDKKEREKKEDKSHPVPSKSDKKEQQLKSNLFKSEATTMKKEKPFANMDESSSSSTSSSSSSSERLEKKIKIEPAAKPMIVQPEKKVKKEKNYQDSAIKCKRKATGLELKEQQPPEKVHKELMNNNSDADAEPVTKLGNISQETEEDYFGVLRDLQQKIMGLKDNSDLQKVVQLIAETGRFEVSAHTFDFDLCLLDRSTVKQLQEFFTQETS